MWLLFNISYYITDVLIIGNDDRFFLINGHRSNFYLTAVQIVGLIPLSFHHINNNVSF